jgi:DNA-binding beta-propeller fold protein YncE
MAALSVVASCWLALAGRAAAPGQLTFVGCVANTPAGGCTDLPSTPLARASGVALSPDGGSVYVASQDSDSVAVFRRDAAGKIAFDGCVADDASQGCTDVPGFPLDGATAVALSPDGGSVYVTSTSTLGSVAVFRRDTAGRLVFDGCVANDAAAGCTDVPGEPLRAANGIVLSPDGAFVYVTSLLSDSVTVFRRDTAGRIFFDGCVANTAADGCTDVPGTPLDFADGMAVSPDRDFLYVAAGGSSSVSVFRRDTAGRLFFDSCVANTVQAVCTVVPGRRSVVRAGWR